MFSFEIFAGAKSYRCTGDISGEQPHEILTVAVKGVGSKTTQLGSGPMGLLARAMAREILREAPHKPL